jgi:hypothetical protein
MLAPPQHSHNMLYQITILKHASVCVTMSLIFVLVTMLMVLLATTGNIRILLVTWQLGLSSATLNKEEVTWSHSPHQA